MSGRRRLVLLAVLFFAPVVAASLLYFAFPDWRPAGTTNHGHLVQPARPLPALDLRDPADQPVQSLRGKWTLAYIGASACGEPCQARLYISRQVRAALNEKRVRVQRVYIAPDAASLAQVRTALAEQHPDLVFLADDAAALRGFFGGGAEDFYLVDPLGNWLMTYPPDIPAAGLFKDLKKLLRNSRIG